MNCKSLYNQNPTFYQTYSSPYNIEEYQTGCGLKNNRYCSYFNASKPNGYFEQNYDKQHSCCCRLQNQPKCYCCCKENRSLFHKLLLAPYTKLQKNKKKYDKNVQTTQERPVKNVIMHQIVKQLPNMQIPSHAFNRPILSNQVQNFVPQQIRFSAMPSIAHNINPMSKNQNIRRVSINNRPVQFFQNQQNWQKITSIPSIHGLLTPNNPQIANLNNQLKPIIKITESQTQIPKRKEGDQSQTSISLKNEKNKAMMNDGQIQPQIKISLVKQPLPVKQVAQVQRKQLDQDRVVIKANNTNQSSLSVLRQQYYSKQSRNVQTSHFQQSKTTSQQSKIQFGSKQVNKQAHLLKQSKHLLMNELDYDQDEQN